MILRISFINSLAAIMLLANCGNKIDTGRNSDPTKWPSRGDGNSSANGTDQQSDGGRGTSVNSCFAIKSSAIPAEISNFCASEIKPIKELNELHSIMCEQGYLVSLLRKPGCGWDGNPQTMKRYAHHYSVQTDHSKDYEDVNATIIHAPVPLSKYLMAPRLAYEDFDEFKRQGFQWMAGTKEQKNLSGTTMENGIHYSFRADKGQYELAYHGIAKTFQLTPTLSVLLNYGNSDFARIAAFSQIVFYQEQADHSTLSVRLEHRRISSQGLYDLAKKSCAEQLKDMFEKGYKNAVKP